jgi:hypothetical protein
MSRTHGTNNPHVARALAELEASLRAFRIIEEEHLRADIARLELLRRNAPALWQALESRRHAHNREVRAMNKRLRAAGCQPTSLDLSLSQKMKKLQRLATRNAAEVARFRASR